MMMAALCCLVLSFAACTRENIDTNDAITVNTAALYEELGIKSEMSQALANGTCTVKKGVMGAELTPKAIGSVIDVQTEELTLPAIILYDMQPQHCIGVHLDPSFGENGRWINETQQETKNAVCRVVKETPSGKFFTLSHGENMKFQISAKKTYSEDSVCVIEHKNLSAGDNWMFYFNYARKYWQPPFLGTHEAFVPWKADRDAGYVACEPYLNWGANFAEVQQHINAKNWWNDGNEQLEFWADPFNGWHKWYHTAPYLTEQYIFETQNGQNLLYVLSYCWYSNVPADARNKMLEHQGFHSTGESVMFDVETFERFLSADGATEALAHNIEGHGNCWEITDL